MNYFVSYVNLETLLPGNTMVPLNGMITSLQDIRNVEEYISKMQKCGAVSIVVYRHIEDGSTMNAPPVVGVPSE
jgi:hypothetical protein